MSKKEIRETVDLHRVLVKKMKNDLKIARNMLSKAKMELMDEIGKDIAAECENRHGCWFFMNTHFYMCHRCLRKNRKELEVY